MLWVLLSLVPRSGVGQETGITRKHHAWGAFQVGAWKRVRVVTDSFDQSGTLTSVTERKTTLRKVEDDGVTLLIESVVEVGGKQISRPQTVKQGWHGELADQEVKISHLGSAEVKIQRRRIPCRVQQVEVSGPASKTTTKIYYSDSEEPFILKRQSVETSLDGATQIGESTVEVVHVEVPRRILAKTWTTFHVKAVHNHSRGKTVTLAVTSMLVPGGVICSTSEEFDPNGRLIRRSKLELAAFGVAFDEERSVWFRRRRIGRFRKRHVFSPYRLGAPFEDQE
jgi:hypothetical protein